jgi:hypothetical protein
MSEGTLMRFEFIAKHRGIWQTSAMCEALEVSRGGFYEWMQRPGRELKYLPRCWDLRRFSMLVDSVTRAVTHAFFVPYRPLNPGHSTEFQLLLVSHFSSSFGSLATTLPSSQT